MLEPLRLAVGFFVALPAAWGATVVVITERLVHHPTFVGDHARGVDDRPMGRYGTLAIWTGMAAITVLGIIALVDDINALV